MHKYKQCLRLHLNSRICDPKVGRAELQSYAVILGVPHGCNRPKIAGCISKLSAGQRQAMWGTLRNAQTQTVFAFPLCKFFHLPICDSCMQKPHWPIASKTCRLGGQNLGAWGQAAGLGRQAKAMVRGIQPKDICRKTSALAPQTWCHWLVGGKWPRHRKKSGCHRALSKKVISNSGFSLIDFCQKNCNSMSMAHALADHVFFISTNQMQP